MIAIDNSIAEFRSAMRDAGMVPPEVIEADGRLYRFHAEGDRRGSRNGWYCLHLDGRAAGVFGSWKTGARSTWTGGGRRLAEAEREAFAELIQTARAKAQAERRAEYELRASEARAIWATGQPADQMHPYLIAKGVQSHTLRQSGVALLVSLLDIHGSLWNVQRILPDGTKRFRPGRAGGLYSPIGDLTDPATLLVCEGWATGATLHEESGHPVLCAMNAGNLLPVAKAARAAWPGADLVICADNDRKTAGNPGLTAATAAAKAVGARLAVPEFPEGASGSDFNDLANLRKGAA
jgi:putative DNA primase/helicase